MTETEQKNKPTNESSEDEGKQNCCELMFSTMQKCMDGEKGSFDCATMMEKMGCASQQKPE